MKKLISIISILLVLAPLAFISCNKEEIKVTSLSAYGPLPVVRGETINFVGECLDVITEVVLPEGVVIPSSSFTDHTAEGFTIVVPQETMPGQVVLKYGSKEITAKVPISFEEPIEVANIDMPGDAVRAGQEITIGGDYLYNIVKVVFSGDAAVEMDSFVSQDRNTITLAVPNEAISGLIYLVDESENQYYSSSTITISQPTISSVAPLTIKAGKELTVSGTDLDLVTKVIFTGGAEVLSSDFSSVSRSAIVVAVPENAQDGVVTSVSYAKQKAVSADELEIVVPTNVAIAAESVFKTGLNVVISGNDLDLVSQMAFTSGAVLELGSGFNYADGKITAVIPDNATDGVVTLTTLSTKTVETPAITLVVPTNLATDKAEYLNGDPITISGNDLDLITNVALNGVEEEFTFDNTNISVTTTKTSSTGALVATLKNGTEVTIADNVIMTPKTEIVVSSIAPATAQVGTEVTIVGKNFNKMESMSIGGTKVLEFVSRTDTELTFLVAPGTPEGEFTLEFTLFTGVIENSVPKIKIIGAVIKVPIWSGSKDLGGWNNFEDLSWNKTPASTLLMKEIKVGATFVMKGIAKPDAQIKIMNPNGWSVIPDVMVLPNFDPAWGVINIGADGEVRFKVLDATVPVIQTAGLVMGGKNWIIEEIYLEYPAN